MVIDTTEKLYDIFHKQYISNYNRNIKGFVVCSHKEYMHTLNISTSRMHSVFNHVKLGLMNGYGHTTGWPIISSINNYSNDFIKLFIIVIGYFIQLEYIEAKIGDDVLLLYPTKHKKITEDLTMDQLYEEYLSIQYNSDDIVGEFEIPINIY